MRSLERLQEYSEGSTTSQPTSEQQARLQQLSNFQLSILRKAASFPAVELLVYSTCSIHAEENEGVVQRFLSEHRAVYELANALPVSAKSRELCTVVRTHSCVAFDKHVAFFLHCTRSGIGAAMRTMG